MFLGDNSLSFIAYSTRVVLKSGKVRRTHTRTHTHLHAHTNTRTHTHTHTHTHMHIHIHTHTKTSTHAWTHVRTHAHTYTHVHTHARTQVLPTMVVSFFAFKRRYSSEQCISVLLIVVGLSTFVLNKEGTHRSEVTNSMGQVWACTRVCLCACEYVCVFMCLSWLVAGPNQPAKLCFVTTCTNWRNFREY
jgi:hypothetical protein